MNSTLQPLSVPARIARIEELRLFSKTIGLTSAQDTEFRELCSVPVPGHAEMNDELAALSAKLDEPFKTTAALHAFVRSGR